MAVAFSVKHLNRVCEILNLQNRHINRVELVFAVKAPVQAHITAFVSEEEVTEILELVGEMQKERGCDANRPAQHTA